jgi:serine/threonine protein kinase
MDLRDKVEHVFQRRIPEEGGCLARGEFIEMLRMLGLQPPEAEEFLDTWDPEHKTHLAYNDFLNFIFGERPDPSGKPSPSEVPSAETRPAASQKKDREELPESKAEPDGTLTCETPPVGFSSPQAHVEESHCEKLKLHCDTACEDEGKKDAPTCEQTSVEESRRREENKLDSAGEVGGKKDSTAVGIGGAGKQGAPDALDQTVDTKDPKQTPCGNTHGSDDTTLPVDTEVGSPSKPSKCFGCMRDEEVFQDPSDLTWYCERCWIDYQPMKLVPVVTQRYWNASEVQDGWHRNPLLNWPPLGPVAVPVSAAGPALSANHNNPLEVWQTVKVRVIPDLVGSHARECTRRDRPYVSEVLAGRYEIIKAVGAGHFTRALLAKDLSDKNEDGSYKQVCVKRHNGITVELLTDLLAIGQRLEKVDPLSVFFPRLFDAFFDMSGYTVEALVAGKNCLELSRENPQMFQNLDNLQRVCKGALQGLARLAEARVVHADVKADNIMWTEPEVAGGEPCIRLVDFGCARLDRRIESGRNWALAEGGAGHLGKWAPEMVLRLPITCLADVWGLAVAQLELYAGRVVWGCEDDTVEVVLAQLLGLVEARDGLPPDLLRRSPLDITQLYTSHPQYFPVRRAVGEHEEIRPAMFGLECVLGRKATWCQRKQDLADYIRLAMQLDPDDRPEAKELMNHPWVTGGVFTRLATEAQEKDTSASQCVEKQPDV